MELDYSDDEAIQDAYSKGLLKPGLLKLERSKNFFKKKSKDLVKNESDDEDEDAGNDDDEDETESGKPKKDVLGINDVGSLEAKLSEIQLPTDYHWVERLDLVNGLAPLAPEIAIELDGHKEKREKEIKIINSIKQKKLGKKNGATKNSASTVLQLIEEDPIHNDFKREMDFYRQAQMAIMTALPTLHELGIPTKRPLDYFAEMAKSDSHMQKVAKVLLKKQTATEKAEKVRKIREQKKFAKQTQVQVQQERQKAKKELTENIKKFRKGQKNSLDFLDDNRKGKKNSKESDDTPRKQINYKRETKNEKYGYGGKKSGTKWNTRESLDEIPGGFNKNRGGRGGFRSRNQGREGNGGGRESRGGSFSRGRGREDSVGRGNRGGNFGRGNRGGSPGRGSRGGSFGRGNRGGSPGRGSRGGTFGGNRGGSFGGNRGGSFGGRQNGNAGRGRGGFRGGVGGGRGRGRR